MVCLVAAAASTAHAFNAAEALVEYSVPSFSESWTRGAGGGLGQDAGVSLPPPPPPPPHDARPIEAGDDARAELVEHLTAGVDWVRAVETMAAAGVDTFLEVGPGKVLTNLIKRINPEVSAIALEDALAADTFDLPFLLPA